MTRYTKLPQFDLEMQTSGKTIQSITISRDTRPDGSTVRRKETLLSDGTILVDERVVVVEQQQQRPAEQQQHVLSSSSTSSSAHKAGPSITTPAAANIRLIPATIDAALSTTSILPQHYYYDISSSSKSRHTNKLVCTSFRIFLILSTSVLLVVLFIQVILLCLMRGGLWADTVNEVLGLN